jgi:uncharacterized membrane protein YhaH (DUF805 family)
MAAGAFALMACGQALASDVYGIAEAVMIGLAMAVLFACIVVVTCVVAWRRCRQHGRRGLWYLLVPVEVVVLTTLTLNLGGGMPWPNGLGYAGVAVLALSLELLAWGAAHLLHHEPADTSRQTRDDR